MSNYLRSQAMEAQLDPTSFTYLINEGEITAVDLPLP